MHTPGPPVLPTSPLVMLYSNKQSDIKTLEYPLIIIAPPLLSSPEPVFAFPYLNEQKTMFERSFVFGVPACSCIFSSKAN